jgi:IS4 transposase
MKLLFLQFLKEKYPIKLRRVALWDEKNEQTIEVITSQMSWTANNITELYKARWEVEIFFRDIRQQLYIKSFAGTSHNAVMRKIWTALITILILKALKKTSATHLVFIKFSCFYKTKPVCESCFT